jgi:acyl-CoA dehydrogenase
MIDARWVAQRHAGSPLWFNQRPVIAYNFRHQDRSREATCLPCGLAGDAGIESTKEVSMVKAYRGELVNEVAHACLQFHGGMGSLESTIERMARDARVHAVVAAQLK